MYTPSGLNILLRPTTLTTPVAPHAAFDRAVFLHPAEQIRVHVLDRSAPLLLEADGQRVAELRQGDCMIINGTRHHWINRSDEPCRVGEVMLGASRREL